MKFHLLSLIIFTVCFSVSAQNVKISAPVLLHDKGVYTMPRLSPDGRFIAYSGERNQGIKIEDLETREVTVISDAPGAGWGYSWSPDSKNIIARESLKDKKGNKFSEIVLYNIASTQRIVLYTQKSTEHLSLPVFSAKGGSVAWAVDSVALNYNLYEDIVENGYTYYGKKILVAPNSAMRMYYKNETAQGEILSTVISPEETRLAVQAAGAGTTVYDHVTGERTVIKGAEHPLWLDDNHLVYMVVNDDGYKLLDADIYIRPAGGGWFENLTKDFESPAMYPTASRNGKLAFATPDGKIYLIEIELLKP